NCSPSFNWSAHLEADEIAKFQNELGAMGFKFQFITLAGFHALNYSMFDLAYGYAREQMTAFVDLQNREFKAAEEPGFTAIKHQRAIGASYFTAIATTVDAYASTTGLECSTEEGHFDFRNCPPSAQDTTNLIHARALAPPSRVGNLIAVASNPALV